MGDQDRSDRIVCRAGDHGSDRVEEEAGSMNLYGWTFIAISWIIIIGFNAFCFYRVFVEPEEEL